MISTAQKKARENFKKAIEYRKKTGCTLKQAFAHISGKKTVTKKVVTVKKTAKKIAGKIKDYTESKYSFNKLTELGKKEGQEGFKKLPKKYHNTYELVLEKILKHTMQPYKKKRKLNVYMAGTKKKVLRSPLKKKAVKKPSEQSILNKIHKVKHDVEKLDESQHKHMSGIEDKMFKDLYDTREKIANTKRAILKLQTFAKISPTQKHIFQNKAKQYKKYLVELNTHYREIKKHI